MPIDFFFAIRSRTVEPSTSSVAIHSTSPVRPAASVFTRCLCSAIAAAARVPAMIASRTATFAAIGALITKTGHALPLGPFALYASAIRTGHRQAPST